MATEQGPLSNGGHCLVDVGIEVTVSHVDGVKRTCFIRCRAVARGATRGRLWHGCRRADGSDSWGVT